MTEYEKQILRTNEIKDQAVSKYNDLVAVLLATAESGSSLPVKLAVFADRLRVLKNFNQNIANKIEKAYSDSVFAAWRQAKREQKEQAEKQNIKEYEKYFTPRELQDGQNLESESLGDIINDSLDSVLLSYISKAEQTAKLQEIAKIRQNELGYEDGQTLQTAPGSQNLQSGFLLRDSKGNAATTGVAIGLMVGDQAWRAIQSGRASAFNFLGLEVLHVSVIDSKTTEICRSLHQSVRVIGRDAIPPLHYNCRSTIEPIITF